MSYLDVSFRGRTLEVEWRCVEDDPTTNAFEIEWFFTDRTDWGSDPTDKEEDAILDAIGQVYADDPGYDDSDFHETGMHS